MGVQTSLNKIEQSALKSWIVRTHGFMRSDWPLAATPLKPCRVHHWISTNFGTLRFFYPTATTNRHYHSCAEWIPFSSIYAQYRFVRELLPFLVPVVIATRVCSHAKTVQDKSDRRRLTILANTFRVVAHIPSRQKGDQSMKALSRVRSISSGILSALIHGLLFMKQFSSFFHYFWISVTFSIQYPGNLLNIAS